ncbi:hypothetical protein [Paenarthrobacter histidinolovorans]|uniref:Uncharacterized protein YifE (UPF0438 family) n=1 Tax=Paenarthrobacter histidinolovorans TaxID=43664 RepID=A0ABW8MZJ3_9MICC
MHGQGVGAGDEEAVGVDVGTGDTEPVGDEEAVGVDVGTGDTEPVGDEEAVGVDVGTGDTEPVGDEEAVGVDVGTGDTEPVGDEEAVGVDVGTGDTEPVGDEEAVGVDVGTGDTEPVGDEEAVGVDVGTGDTEPVGDEEAVGVDVGTGDTEPVGDERPFGGTTSETGASDNGCDADPPAPAIGLGVAVLRGVEMCEGEVELAARFVEVLNTWGINNPMIAAAKVTVTTERRPAFKIGRRVGQLGSESRNPGDSRGKPTRIGVRIPRMVLLTFFRSATTDLQSEQRSVCTSVELRSRTDAVPSTVLAMAGSAFLHSGSVVGFTA